MFVDISSSLVDCVARMHDLELYEDLLLYTDLNLSNQYKLEKLNEDDQAFVHFCIAEAHFQMGNFAQSVRHYEYTLKILSLLRRKDTTAASAYRKLLNAAEVRFRLHRALLKEGKEQDALKCLEAVTKSEMSPKILYAVARLHNTQRRSLKSASTANNGSTFPTSAGLSHQQCFSSAAGVRSINHLKQLIKIVPEAILCKSYLIATNNLQLDENSNMGKLSAEARAWLEAKRLEAQRKFADAAQVLNAVQNPSLRNMAGVKHKALANYQRAHSLDPQNTEGMDVFASLLCLSSSGRELEQLVNKMSTMSSPQSPEIFVAYGYLAKLNRNPKEGQLFAARAESLSQSERQRAEALVLKAHLLLDLKRNVRELNHILAEALLNDYLNIQCYEIYVKGCLQTKACYVEALRMCDRAAKALGSDNFRIKFLRAKVLSEQQIGSSGDGAGNAEAILLLEEVVARASYIQEAVPLLASLYDRAQAYEKAIAFLRQCKEVNNTSQVSRLLGDFLIKTNRHELASIEYTNALSFAKPDPVALNKMAALSSGFQSQKGGGLGSGITTPENTISLHSLNANNNHGANSATGSFNSSQVISASIGSGGGDNRMIPVPAAPIGNRRRPSVVAGGANANNNAVNGQQQQPVISYARRGGGRIVATSRLSAGQRSAATGHFAFVTSSPSQSTVTGSAIAAASISSNFSPATGMRRGAGDRASVASHTVFYSPSTGSGSGPLTRNRHQRQSVSSQSVRSFTVGRPLEPITPPNFDLLGDEGNEPMDTASIQSGPIGGNRDGGDQQLSDVDNYLAGTDEDGAGDEDNDDDEAFLETGSDEFESDGNHNNNNNDQAAAPQQQNEADEPNDEFEESESDVDEDDGSTARTRHWHNRPTPQSYHGSGNRLTGDFLRRLDRYHRGEEGGGQQETTASSVNGGTSAAAADGESVRTRRAPTPASTGNNAVAAGGGRRRRQQSQQQQSAGGAATTTVAAANTSEQQQQALLLEDEEEGDLMMAAMTSDDDEGESAAGRRAAQQLQRGTAARINAGGRMPSGSSGTSTARTTRRYPRRW